MKYKRNEAMDYARANLKGLWGAALMPDAVDGAMDEAGFRRNLRHWFDDLGIKGVFVGGKQGEFWAQSLAERKRCFEIAVEEARGKAHTIVSCSDQNLDTAMVLARHAEAVGCDFIVMHAPVLSFVTDQDEILRQYYTYISERLDIGIAMWSHPDSGYLMKPELCAEIADLPNIVAIKYSVPREMYVKLHHMAKHKLIVSTASEEEWFDNVVELGWQVYLSSSPPYLFQTRNDKRIQQYSDLAWAGKVDEARRVRDSLEPVRKAFRSTRPGGKPHAHSKRWQELLGQVGGAVRRPALALTDAERAAVDAAFAGCGLKL